MFPALLACCVGDGALFTSNKQVCSLNAVWGHRPLLGEHQNGLLLIADYDFHFPYTVKYKCCHLFILAHNVQKYIGVQKS